MNKGLSLGLLIAVVFPILFFLFFDHFDFFNVIGRDNRPKLPRIIIAQDVNQPNKIKVNDTLWHQVPPFEFIGQHGKIVSDKDFENKIIVTDFFFTHCKGICPKMSSQMQRIQRQFKNDDDIRLLSHTVDPERDDAERLAEYADMYEADSSKWFFVTGDKKALYHQARKGYFLNATEGDGGPEDFIHSERIVLVDKDKVIRGYYDGTDPESVNKLMVDIKILQLSYSRGKSRKVLELDRERAAKTEMDKNTK